MALRGPVTSSELRQLNGMSSEDAALAAAVAASLTSSPGQQVPGIIRGTSTSTVRSSSTSAIQGTSTVRGTTNPTIRSNSTSAIRGTSTARGTSISTNRGTSTSTRPVTGRSPGVGVPGELHLVIEQEQEEGAWLNHALPLWIEVATFLKAFGKSLLSPLETWGKVFDNQEHELLLCCCCCIWIPLFLAYCLAVAILITSATLGAAAVGFVQSVIFLFVGVWPGVCLALAITGISIIRTPYNIYYHCNIVYKDLLHGNLVKALSFLLLLPVQGLFPLVMSAASLCAIPIAAVVAFFGCPQVPWAEFRPNLTKYSILLATEVKLRVKSYRPEEGGGNYANHFWSLLRLSDVLTGTTILFITPGPLFKQASKIPNFDMAAVVIGIFFPLWLPLVAVYCVTFAAALGFITTALFFIQLYQSLINSFLGVWPGFILAVDITAMAVIRLPCNIYYHCLVAFKSLAAGHFIKAVNYLLLLPIQALPPVYLAATSLLAGPLLAGSLAIIGCPQQPWGELASRHRQAWCVLAQDVAAAANAFNPGTRETYMEENIAMPFWRSIGKAKEALAKVFKEPAESTTEASTSVLRWSLSLPILSCLGLAALLACCLLALVLLLPLVLVGLTQSLFFLSVGIWPAFIIATVITLISIVRIPWNIAYHFLITYRTVMLDRYLKVFFFVFVPPTHFLVPGVIGVVGFGGGIPAAGGLSFYGQPQVPWLKMVHIIRKFWKRYVTDVKAHVENYGHPSGIPDNWDGKMYGLPLDPMTIVMSILFYVYAVVPVTVTTVTMALIKAFPILVGTVVEYWKRFNPCTAIKQWADMIKTLALWDACGMFNNIITFYFEEAVRLIRQSPDLVTGIAKEYVKENRLKECVPKDPCETIVVSPWLLLVSIFWCVGLVLAILLTILFIIGSVIAWVLCWTLVLSLPPATYLVAWASLLVLLPVSYTVLWLFGFTVAVLSPWGPLLVLMVSGPLLAFKVAYIVFKHNLLNPHELDISFKKGIKKPLIIAKDLDRLTKTYAFRKWSIWEHPEEEQNLHPIEEIFREIDYWSLFFERSTQEVLKVTTKNWLTKDDIAEASSTAMVAIPGFTVLAILTDSVKREAKDPSLIYWDERNQCSERRRNKRDNVANLFFPQLVRLKTGLRQLREAGADLDECEAFISASFCDGADDKTVELKQFLDGRAMDEPRRRMCLKVRSEVENVVHSLLRVQKMQTSLGRLCQQDYTRRQGGGETAAALMADNIAYIDDEIGLTSRPMANACS